MPRTATGRTARFVAAFTLGRVRHLEAPGSSPRMHARKGPSRARACAGVASRPGQRGQTGCSRSVGPRTTRAEAGRSRLGKTQDRCEDKATYNRHDDRLYDARPVVRANRGNFDGFFRGVSAGSCAAAASSNSVVRVRSWSTIDSSTLTTANVERRQGREAGRGVDVVHAAMGATLQQHVDRLRCLANALDCRLQFLRTREEFVSGT